jgi:phosphoribosylglycinamide formyltransferase-1
MKRIGILGSGKGSNFEAIAEASRQAEFGGEIVLVLSDVENAGILSLAQKFDVSAQFVHPGKFRTKLEPQIEEEYIRLLKNARVDLVVLAGFMRILKSPFLSAFPDRVMNVHPSLLPSFPGLEAWKQAWEYGVKYTGCTVHFVTPEMDAGPIIQQAVVPVLPDDTHESLHQRIQHEEHRIYVESIREWCKGRLKVEKGCRIVYLMDAVNT